MVKEVFEQVQAARQSEHIAADFIARFGKVDESQVRIEELLAGVKAMTYRDAGVEREGEIGLWHNLKSDIMAGRHSEDVVHAVAVRAICRSIAKAKLKAIHDHHRQRRQSVI